MWTLAYVGSVVLVNAMFILLPPFMAGGVVLTWGSFVVGATFILRDFAQREVGHRVLWATLIGTAITAAMSAELALASGAAFLASELLDWAVFTRLPGSFRCRVVASSLIGAPVDSALFMLLAGFFSWPGVAVMTASKLVALVIVARRRTISLGQSVSEVTP
ncbi:MAG: VUT family protein [Betaproteobacteria bacterium]|nr:VUT family protein [Betaproteobacteria bacterium]